MPKLLLLILILCIPCLLKAQVENVIPVSMAVANTATARNDQWTAFQNPAALVQTETFQVALQYENRYLIGEFSTELLQGAYSNDYVNVGIAYSFFGYERYSEMMAAVVLARRFGQFSLGLQGNFIAVYCGDDLGYRMTGVPQLGMTVDITPDFTLGFQTFNPFVQSIKVEDRRRKLPSAYSLGTDYRFHKDFRWDVQLDYDINTTFRIATGFEWQAIRELCVKLGAYYQQYLVACLGLGLHFGIFRCDIAAEWHPVLGVNLMSKLAFQWQ